MMTVAASTPKTKAFYAHLDDQPGALVTVGGILTFVGEDGVITTVEPAMITFLVVLGEMIPAEAQRLADRMAGGPVGLCLSRRQEVQ